MGRPDACNVQVGVISESCGIGLALLLRPKVALDMHTDGASEGRAPLQLLGRYAL